VAAPSAAIEPQTKDGLMTQDFEEAPAVKKPAETKKPDQKTVTKPVKTTAPAEPQKPAVNTRALYSNKGGTSGQSTTESGTSEGIYKGSGNMGDPSGSVASDNYSKDWEEKVLRSISMAGVPYTCRNPNLIY